MAVLGVASILPAFPTIIEELNISKTDVGMLISAFTFPAVILSPFIGILADKFGRRRVLVPSLFLFGLAGGACALTGEFNTLIILRVLQGMGGAALASLNVTILGDLYSGNRRAEAMGLNASVMGIGTAAYPIIGGALATLAWNYPFLLSLVAIPIGVIVLRSLHNPEPRSKQSLREYLGGTWGYLKNMRVAGAFMAGFILFVLLYGPYLTYLSLFLGCSFQASPFIIGAVLSCMSVATALVASQLGRIVKFVSEPNLIKLGFVLYTIALVLLPFMPRLGLMLIPVVIFGLGLGISGPSLLTYIAGLTPTEYRAGFMSVNGAMLRLGQTVGPLLFGLVYTYADFDGVFLYGAGLALATAIVGFIGGKLIR